MEKCVQKKSRKCKICVHCTSFFAHNTVVQQSCKLLSTTYTGDQYYTVCICRDGVILLIPEEKQWRIR